MRNFIFGFIFGIALVACCTSFAKEIIVDFKPNSVSVLNEELRQIQVTLKNHEDRLVVGGL